MRVYYKLVAIMPTNVPGGIRKIEVEIMPDHMSYINALYDSEDNKIDEYEHTYRKNYDEKLGEDFLIEVFNSAKDIEIIRFFRYVPEANRLEQIESRLF